MGDNKFSAHRIVLAATIPYFHAMFTHDMVESKQDEITVQGIEARLVHNIHNMCQHSILASASSNVFSLFLLNMLQSYQCCCSFAARLSQ